jgi:hypothetical protein
VPVGGPPTGGSGLAVPTTAAPQVGHRMAPLLLTDGTISATAGQLQARGVRSLSTRQDHRTCWADLGWLEVAVQGLGTCISHHLNRSVPWSSAHLCLYVVVGLSPVQAFPTEVGPTCSASPSRRRGSSMVSCSVEMTHLLVALARTRVARTSMTFSGGH